MIGKRKRDTSIVSRSTMEEDQEQIDPSPDTSYQDVFRKFFESQFKPLELPGGQIDRERELEENRQEDSEGSESGSDWDGVSEDEGNQVEVVEHCNTTKEEKGLLDKKARKAFMTAKPPQLSTDSTTTKKSSKKPKTEKDDDEEDAMDAEHLKNDLALQRLLKESHLLDSASELAPTGKNRLKALDLRMQSLGAKTSLYHQKMPSSHRRGIKAKALGKEEKRRREAKENGIILEKPTHKSKVSKGRRERGISGPSIGKLSGGTLNLSKRDIAVVTSARRSGKGKSKKRR